MLATCSELHHQHRSTSATSARDEGTKNRKKDKNLTVAKWLFAETTHVVRSKRNFAWLVGLREIIRSVSSKSVKRFPRCGIEIGPFPLHWPLAYTTACTTVQVVITTLLVLRKLILNLGLFAMSQTTSGRFAVR